MPISSINTPKSSGDAAWVARAGALSLNSKLVDINKTARFRCFTDLLDE
jgi:hypothetical protein